MLCERASVPKRNPPRSASAGAAPPRGRLGAEVARGRASSMIVAVLLAAAPPVPTAFAQNVPEGARAADQPAPAANAGAFRHLRALQDIATASGGNRAAGTPGYDRSAEYVSEQLAKAGYQVRFEEFEFPFFQERSPAVLVVNTAGGAQQPASTAAVRTLSDSGSGDVTARLRAVNLQLGAEPPAASASGCEGGDFKDFERGAVALIRRGTCQFQTKVENAVAAGAGKRPSRNVVAETSGSGDGSWIMVGAHLDSVPEGPGINDNGSGTAAVLEAALQLAQEPAQRSRHVRFAFWGAEERGLIGSRHHVDALSEEERRRIALYINLDMVGSPNFTRYVQGPAATDDGPAAVARRELMAEFRGRGLNIEERTGTRFGSDDSSFSQKDIPTVGLYTGASGAKSEKQASLFGGTAGRPFDPCYHQACDTTENIDSNVLEQNTEALVRALKAVAIAAGEPERRKAP